MKQRTLILGAGVALLATAGAAWALREDPPPRAPVEFADKDSGMTLDRQIDLAKEIGYIQQDEE